MQRSLTVLSSRVIECIFLSHDLIVIVSDQVEKTQSGNSLVPD